MRLLALSGAALLLVSLAGCTGPGAEDDAPVTPGESASSEPDASGGPDDCGSLTTDDLTRIFGLDLTGPDLEHGDSDQNGVTWTSTGCDWENEAEDFDLDLDISVGSDFADGKIACLEPTGAGEVTPVAGVGTQAWWKFDDVDESEGELRVCTDDSLVEIEVDAASGSQSSDDLRDKVTEAIRIVVG